MRIALTGNPNSGKTTMYNALTVFYAETVPDSVIITALNRIGYKVTT